MFGDPRWPSWTDSLACCAYLRDPAREQVFDDGAEYDVAEVVRRLDHIDALRTMTNVCRRFLPNVEAESRASR